MTINLNEIAKEIHQNAVNHGWWDEERSLPEIIALCHSELSEALEEYRDGRGMVWYDAYNKPEGIAVEMVDCIIRILDYLQYRNVDIEAILPPHKPVPATAPAARTPFLCKRSAAPSGQQYFLKTQALFFSNADKAL